MRILLGSGGFRSDERRERLVAEMRDFFAGCQRVLFVPYALDDHDRYLEVMVERGLGAGFELEGIHRFDDPRRAVEQAEAIYVGGGNTFRLLHDLYAHDLVELIRERVRGGLPYMGVSAGTNVACPTMMTTNDMPIVMPPTFEALGLVPFQVNAHYFDGQTHVKVGDSYHEHFGETRDDRIREFHEMNETPVVGLWEGGMLRVENGGVRLVAAPARVFASGADPIDFEPPAQLEGALSDR